jgi:uncharacterized protein YgiM (DUF1202 family)
MPMNRVAGCRAVAVIATAALSLAAAAAVAQPYTPPQGEANVPAYGAAGTTTAVHAVFMRAGPSTDQPVVGTLQPGMPAQVLASANYGWVQVQSPAGTGWVYGSYLAPGAGGSAPAPAAGYGSPPGPEISSP